MSDDFSKYARQCALDSFGKSAQEKLRSSKLVLLGAGGVGCAALPLLVGAGVGRIEIIDGDIVSPDNLHRQTVYSQSDVGSPKAECAAAKMRALNPDVQLSANKIFITEPAQLASILRGADICIDASDNFCTRFIAGDACENYGVNLISASAENWVSQTVRLGEGFRIRDFIKDESAEGEKSQGLPIFGPAAAFAGVLAAGMALRVLASLEDFKAGGFCRFSFQTNKFLTTNLKELQ